MFLFMYVCSCLQKMRGGGYNLAHILIGEGKCEKGTHGKIKDFLER